MKRYIHTKTTTSILTYTDKYSHRHCAVFTVMDAHTHTHTYSTWLVLTYSSAHKILSKLSLKVVIQTLSGEWKQNTEKGRQSKEFKGGTEGKLDREKKKKLCKKKEVQKENLQVFLWVKLMTYVWCMCTCRHTAHVARDGRDGRQLSKTSHLSSPQQH